MKRSLSLGMLFRKFRTDRDLSDELSAHFQELVEDGIEAGLTRDEAQRRARLKLGSAPGILENVREGEFRTMIESWYRDFTLGLRSIRRNPVFAVTATDDRRRNRRKHHSLYFALWAASLQPPGERT